MRRGLKVCLFIIVGIFLLAAAICGQEKVSISDFYKDIELFSDAISLVSADYVEAVTPKKLIYGALKGMLSSLDGYSQFMDPDSFKEMKIDAKGKFGGLGIEISIRDNMLTIISPIDGTPAAKAGLMPGDVIVKIDGELTRNIALYEAVKKLRGKPGSSVKLGIYREKESKLLDVTIVREMINIKSIKDARILEDGIGYVKLVEFQEKSAKELEGELKKLRAQNLEGLILDLRNNPGGLLDASIGVSELFLEKGKLIVSTKGRNPEHNKEFKARRNEAFKDLTLIVLVNEGSASASEIVAGAIKDNERGVVVGVKTFGKGSVQTVVPLKDGSALRMTTAEYFTPAGHSIVKSGVIPDIIVKAETKEVAPKKKDIFKEIEGEEKKIEEPEELDNQLKAALDIMKALILCKDKTNA